MEAAPACQSNTNHAMNYINDVQTRVSPHISQQFLNILQNYCEDPTSIGDVHTQVQSLFSSYPDLVEGFEQFLPRSGVTDDKGQLEEEPDKTTKDETH